MPYAAGDSIDRYTIVSRLGEGGQGAVFRARDRLEDREVALKLVSTEGARPATLERSRREGELLSRLDHPSLVTCVRAFDDYERRIFGLELELVHGVSLRDALRRGQLGSPGRRWALHHVAHALAYLHQRGLVHRDVKPENVLLEERFWEDPSNPRSVRLVDLGIAIESGNPRPLTDVGSVIGTSPYLAPELLVPAVFGDPEADDATTPARDVFAFGALALEVLEGRLPSGLGPEASRAALAATYVASRSHPDFPPILASSVYAPLLRGCLSLYPGRRLRDGTAILEFLPAPPRTVEQQTPTPPSAGRVSAPQSSQRLDRTGPSVVISERPALRSKGPAAWPATALAAGALTLLTLVALAFLWGNDEVEETPMIPLPAASRANAVPAPSATASPPKAVPAPSTSTRLQPGPPGSALPPVPRSSAMAPATTASPKAPQPPKDSRYLPWGSLSIRRRPVWVSDFQHCVSCEGGKEAHWPGATPAEVESATLRCPLSSRNPKRKAIDRLTCVTFAQAEAYCRFEEARLPTHHELKKATDQEKLEGVPLCKDRVGNKDCAHEWTRTWVAESVPRTFHVPDWEASNPATASNPDLGFRCVKDTR